jgi:MFS family permease
MANDQPADSHGAEPTRLRPELLILIGGLVATAHASVMITLPVMPRFIDSIGGTGFALGLSFSASFIGRFVTNIPAGLLSERIGRKPVILTGAIGIAVFATLTGTANDVPTLLLYRLLMGVFSAMTITVANVAATDLSRVENRGRVLGMLHGMQLIVGIFAPSLGGFVGEFVDIRAPFLWSGAGIAVMAVWALARLPETSPPRLEARSVTAKAGGAPRFASLALLRDPSFFMVCMLGFSTFFLRGGAVTTLIPLYADQVLGAGPGVLGILFTAASVLHGVLVYPAGVIADRFGRKPVIVPAGIVVGLGMAAFPFGTTMLTFVLVFLLFHFATGFSGQAPVAYLGDLAPAHLRGMSFGLYRTFGDMAGIVAPVIATGLAEAISFHAAFFFNGALWLVTLLLFSRIAVETAGRNAKRKEALLTSPPAGE